eukprot:9316812-Pyramimonas_sp.AAC.1
MLSALKRVDGESNAEGDSNKARKGKDVEDSHVKARLLRQLDFGSSRYGPSVDTLKQTYQEHQYQMKVEGKNNTHGLELQNFAVRHSAFNSWLDKPGKDSVKELADTLRLLLMMKGDQEWIKESGTSSTADSSISRITVK